MGYTKKLVCLANSRKLSGHCIAGKNFILNRLLRTITTLFGLFIVYFMSTGFPAYMYAVHLEEQWTNADPKTKVELEIFLHYYSTHVIKPSESLWGNRYRLRNNERMVQYLILWSMPLDVVYDSENNIKAIYTSYE